MVTPAPQIRHLPLRIPAWERAALQRRRKRRSVRAVL